MRITSRIIAFALVLAIILSLGVAALADAEPQSETTPAEESLPAETEIPVAEEDAPAADEEEPLPGDMQESEPVPTPEEVEDTSLLPVEEPEEEPVQDEAAEETEEFASEEMEEESAEERPWVAPGNTDAEILGGGHFLSRGGTLYFSDGGIWVSQNGSERLLSADEGENLNLVDGWLYYTTESGDVRRVPASGGSAETV